MLHGGWSGVDIGVDEVVRLKWIFTFDRSLYTTSDINI